VFIHMPAALTFPIGSRFYDWRYSSEPEPFMHGRRTYHARGKVLGGSSSINGMIFQRGNPLDYERWAADPGLGTLDYAHCLPYFKRMETCLAGGDEFRGTGGPLVLERGTASSPLFQAFFAAVQEAGYPLTADVNGYRQEGFAAFDRNVHRGRRLSAARAYLHPALRFNYLSTAQDRREWPEAIRVARRILGQPAFGPFNARELLPGPDVATDGQLLDWVARDGETALHPAAPASWAPASWP
jgi:choline dehydrogenase-like flavoprotein